MMITRGLLQTLSGFAALSAVLGIGAAAQAAFDPADVRTTTRFGPPTIFGVASDGVIETGDPLIGLEVVHVRTYWDIVVADGQDAANIIADVNLPIDTYSGLAARLVLNGPVLGWAGPGTFHHFESTDRFNGVFSEAGTWFGFSSWGLPFGTVEVLTSSRIEIDYLLPPGDFNGDGMIEATDLTLLLSHWGETQQPAEWISHWDGRVDTNELTGLLENWGAGVGVGGTAEPLDAAAMAYLIPEPATLSLLAMGGWMAAMRASRKS